jgi:hypothetical protein
MHLFPHGEEVGVLVIVIKIIFHAGQVTYFIQRAVFLAFGKGIYKFFGGIDIVV